MTSKEKNEMTSLYDQSDMAFERLYMRSSHAFGSLTAPAAASVKASTPRPPNEQSKSKTRAHVDVEKLNKLTGALHKARGSPSNFIDYSRFAEKNFDPHGVFTTPTKKATYSSDRAKELYNEVQRNSLNFGVTWEEMKSYHKRKVSTLSDYSAQQSRSHSPKPQALPPLAPNPESRIDKEDAIQKQELVVDTQASNPAKSIMTPLIPRKPQSRKQQRLHADNDLPGIVTTSAQRAGTFITVTPGRKTAKLPLDEATDVTKRQGLFLEPFDSAHSQSKSSLLTPPSDFINTTAFDRFKETTSKSENTADASQDSPLLAKKQINPFEDRTFNERGELTKKESDKGGSSEEGTLSPKTHSRLMSYPPGSQSSLCRSTLGSLFRRKSQSSLTPTRRECRSVEDTLLADKEFRDFTIDRRRSGSYYAKALEFSFERPNSKRASSRSSIVLQSPRTPHSEQPSTSTRPHSISTFSTPPSSPRVQRHSMSDVISSVESSPVTPTRRLRGYVRGSSSMYSPSRGVRSASLFFHPIVEHEQADRSEKPLV